MINDKIKQNVILAPFTTFQIGGSAKFFVMVENKEELQEALAFAQDKGIPYFILGGGSNLLISDQGFPGLVIKINYQDIAIEGETLTAGAGAKLSETVAWAADAGLSGLEWACGIPGTIGGAVRGNAGAFGSDISASVMTVEYFDIATAEFTVLTKADCAFAYRTSLFKQATGKIIWQIKLQLIRGEAGHILTTMEEILAKRISGQPKEPSAGCVFKNLLSAQDLAEKLAISDKMRGGKLACGLIVEKLNLKGRQIGGAKISEAHANFIVNAGDAKAKDVRALINLIKQEAKDKYGLILEEEIQYLGL
jgi:UDP-N-acetylmuramate dehydrogenase